MDEDDFFDRINRILRPEGAAEMGAFLGASMLPGIGEGIDVADILMGLRERDAQRIGFGALGLALPFVAGGTLRRIAGKGGSGMDTPPSTVPKTLPKDDLPDGFGDLPDGFGVHVDPDGSQTIDFGDEVVAGIEAEQERFLKDYLEMSGPFSEEELLSMTVADDPMRKDEKLKAKWILEIASGRLGKRERELPLILRALARSDDPNIPELEREHLEMFWNPELGDYDRSAQIGDFMDQWEETGLVDSITDLDFEEALQVFRRLNAVARETIPQRVADILKNPLRTSRYGAGPAQKVDPAFSGPRKFRVYRSDDRLHSPVIGTSPIKSTANFWARRGGTEGEGVYRGRKPGIRTFELEPEDVVLDLPGFADEVGATLRFTGEQELMALRDTLARKEIINPDDYERIEDYLMAVARIGMDPSKLDEYAESLERQRKNMLSDIIVPISRPAKKHELQRMVETRQLLDPPSQGFKTSGLPFPQSVKVFTNPGSMDEPLLDPVRPQFELYSRADVRKDLKTSMQEAIKGGITDAGEIIPPDPNLLDKLVKEAAEIAGSGPKQTNVPPLRNPSYFASNPWAAAQDVRSALRGTPFNALAINAATLGSRMTRGLDPSKSDFIGKNKGNNEQMAGLRTRLQNDVNKMLEALETYKGKSKKQIEDLLLPSAEKWLKKDNWKLPNKMWGTELSYSRDEAFFDKMRLNLRRMSDAQRQVPAYNEMQKFGRDIAVAVGEGDLEEADRLLQSLKLIVDDKQVFARKILEYGIPDPSIPEIIRRRVGYHVDDRPL
jgi:hypothetical protein